VQVQYLIFDNKVGVYLTRNGVGFCWASAKKRAAVFNEYQARIWQEQLVKITGKVNFSILQVEA
jgi:hypothetical protein